MGGGGNPELSAKAAQRSTCSHATRNAYHTLRKVKAGSGKVEVGTMRALWVAPGLLPTDTRGEVFLCWCKVLTSERIVCYAVQKWEGEERVFENGRADSDTSFLLVESLFALSDGAVVPFL